jgi:flagellar biosynthetic protein FliR
MNELVISDAQLSAFIGQYLWPLIRISAFFLAVPVIGARTVPARLRIVLAVFTAMLLAPLLPEPPGISFLSVEAMALVVKEVVIGLALGFIMQVVLHVFVLSGQMIAMKMGLGFASMNDPANGVSVTVLSQFYLLLTTLLFLAVNGHIAMIELLVQSYAVFPLMGEGLGAEAFGGIANLGTWLFSAALLVTLPLFTSVMVVNMSFGVMSRSAPQMNVFTVGFPITLIFGLLLMWFSLSNFLPLFELLLAEGFVHLTELTGVQ